MIRQGDILNHRDFLKVLKKSLTWEVVIQIGDLDEYFPLDQADDDILCTPGVVVLFWFHDEYYLALFNIPYLLFNMWKYSSRKQYPYNFHDNMLPVLGLTFIDPQVPLSKRLKGS